MTIQIYIESNTYEPLTPINFAAAMTNQHMFNTDQLEELAEYLLVHCKHDRMAEKGEILHE